LRYLLDFRRLTKLCSPPPLGRAQTEGDLVTAFTIPKAINEIDPATIPVIPNVGKDRLLFLGHGIHLDSSLRPE
jgi:hypothetical protein